MTGRSRAASIFAKQRYQLLGAFIFAVAVPFLARYYITGIVHFWDQLNTSLYVIIGLAISHILIQDLSRYPGEDPLSSVVPSVFIGFSCVLLMIAMAHLSYSRMIIFAGFTVTVLWYSLLSYMKARVMLPRLMIVMTLPDYNITKNRSAKWIEVTSPHHPKDLPPSDGLVIDLSSDLPRAWQDFAVSCAVSGIPIYDIKKTYELLTGEASINSLEDIGIDALLPRRPYLVSKAIIDFLAAIILLPIALIIVSVACLAIKIETKGPAIFVQKRVGFRGRIFKCYKLRSMQQDAEEAGPQYTLQDDQRITRVGSFIRKYRIDEVPQIFNIIKGEMSWIGPRPEACGLARKYEEHIPFYAFRHSVRPGITGWAAVRQGNVAEVDAAKTKLKNDFFYIKNISLGLDAFICVKTIWIIVTGFGSKS